MKIYQPPPDKSITLRALLLGAIARGRTTIKNPLFCADTAAAIGCLRAMGVKLRINKQKILIEGRGLKGLKAPRRTLQAAEAGALARLLAGIMAGQSFPAKVTGAPSLRLRPMARAAAPLAQMGARITTRRGKLPFKIQPPGAAGLHGIKYLMPVASAQVKSAILLAGLYACGNTIVLEPVASRDHMERLLAHFGRRIARRNRTITLTPGPLTGASLSVPGDISAAAPFIAGALLLKRELLVKNVGLNPSRLGFIKTLKRMGASFTITVACRRPEPAGDILVHPAKLKGSVVTGAEIPAMIDELPLLAVIGAATKGTTIIHGAGELRHKESDRIKATLNLLAAIGAPARYSRGTLTISGGLPLRGGRVHSCRDHRIAMAAAVAGLLTQTPLKIEAPDCVKKSYPAFFYDFRKMFLC